MPLSPGDRQQQFFDMNKDILSGINRLFPFRRLFWFILGLSVSVQVVVIVYSHLTGFVPLVSIGHFLVRLIFGTLLGFLSGFMLALPDLLTIDRLNNIYPWGGRAVPRVIIQFFLSILFAVIVSTLMTLFSDLLGPYEEELKRVLITNALIVIVLNIILMITLEAWIFFNEGSRARRKAENLERELSQIRFEMLKSQINPHFMFNSLNVLSGLMEKDVVRAQKFIDEFSMIYRYVLETIEKPVVTLGEELAFVRSYFFLQQIRYGDSLTLSVNLPSELLELLLPPLSLQVVLENAIKHNIVNASQPLQIDISGSGRQLVIRNNLQPKISAYTSTHLGQANLSRRYAMITTEEPGFFVETGFYKVKLPLIDS